MISFIKGMVHARDGGSVVVLTASGVGYEITIPVRYDRMLAGAEIELFTFLKITDHSMELFGFKTRAERSFFSLLLSVSGVGPRSALNILSLGSLEEIQNAIAGGDISYLTAVQGMGKKTAERLVVELKHKIKPQTGGTKTDQDSVILEEVIEGLVSLGYGRDEARSAVRGMDTEGKSSEEVLREALRSVK